MGNVFARSSRAQNIQIFADEAWLSGDLYLPDKARAIVLFVHGSGSSRFSSRNRYVAEVLRQSQLATLLFDLFSAEEETYDLSTRKLRFDIEFLTKRVLRVADWLKSSRETKHLSVGYFGASTGAAATLCAAATRPESVRAIVSRGGRPDLAGAALEKVQAPTLLIVGGNDIPVLALNQLALQRLPGQKKLEIIPGASHLFEEKGTLEQVVALAKSWFEQYL